jgi:hypothetical protein
MHEFLLLLPPRPSLAAEPEKSCIAMYLLQGVAAKDNKKRIEEQPDADNIICNVVDPETGEILHSNVSSQGVAAKEKK